MVGALPDSANHCTQQRDSGGLLQVPTSAKILRAKYRENCSQFRILPMFAQDCFPGASYQPIAGRYMSIMQSMMSQLSTPTIRTAMSWRSMVDCRSQYGSSLENRFIVYDHFLIGKKCTDGYSFKGGRSNQLGTFTVVSIAGAEHSTEATDVHYLADCNEDRYTRHQIDQMSDTEFLIVNICGIPYLMGCTMVGLIHTACEDSKSMQMSFGRGGPRSKSKFIFGKFDADTVCARWKTAFMPICVAGYGAQDRWLSFARNQLRIKCQNEWGGVCKAELVPFTKTVHCEEINQHREAYEAIYEWYSKCTSDLAGLQWHQWITGASIRQKCVEPLHCLIRISGHVMKWYILYCIEYFSWVQDHQNSDFLQHNYTASNNEYSQWTRGQIEKHFRKCCHIPFKYNPNSPTKSTIASEGSWRRRLWPVLYRVVACDKCTWRPWKHCRVEPYFAVFFLNLMETLLPLELLHWDAFSELWDKNLRQRHINRWSQTNRHSNSSPMDMDESEGEEDDDSKLPELPRLGEGGTSSRSKKSKLEYNTGSLWSVFSVHFFTMFMVLFGSHRMTRYVHGLVFCTQYGFEVAHALKLTYRGAFGSDGVERMNSCTKTVNHTASSRFGGGHGKRHRRPPTATLEQVMRWILHDRYLFREGGERMNLKYRQQKQLLPRQIEGDQVKLKLPDRVHYGFVQRGVSLRLRCPLSNCHHRIGRFATTPRDAFGLDIYGSEIDLTDAEEDDEQQSSMRDRLNYMLSRAHEIEDLDAERAARQRQQEHGLSGLELGEVTTDSELESDAENDERPLLVKYTNVTALATPHREPITEATISQQNLGLFPNNADDFVVNGTRWIPFPATLSATRFLFSEYWLRLYTAMERESDETATENRSESVQRRRKKKKNTIKTYFRLTWNYHQLRYISFHLAPRSCALFLKMVSVPFKIEEKPSGGSWTTTRVLSREFEVMNECGKLALWIDQNAYELSDIHRMLRKFHRFAPEHRIGADAFAQVPWEYTTKEKAEAMRYYQAKKNPLLGRHDLLCNEIDDLMQQQRTGGTRKCLSCGVSFGWFERHSYCFTEDEEANNVAKHIFERLVYDNYNETDVQIKIVSDPVQPGAYTSAQQLMREDYQLWSMYIMHVYVLLVKYLHNEKYYEFINCKVDADWENLCCPVDLWIAMLDRAMVSSLQECSRSRAQMGDRDSVFRKMILILSDMYIIPCEPIHAAAASMDLYRNWTRRQRVKIWGHSRFVVRFKHHYQKARVCTSTVFIWMLTTHWREIVPPSFGRLHFDTLITAEDEQ